MLSTSQHAHEDDWIDCNTFSISEATKTDYHTYILNDFIYKKHNPYISAMLRLDLEPLPRTISLEFLQTELPSTTWTIFTCISPLIQTRQVKEDLIFATTA